MSVTSGNRFIHCARGPSARRRLDWTVDAPTGEPVLVMYGTTQSDAAILASTFGGELFGLGQPLDARRYYLTLPDSVGHGLLSKPSDGLRTRFPKHNYDDIGRLVEL